MLIEKVRKLLFACNHPIYLIKYYKLRESSFEDSLKFHANETLKLLSEKFKHKKFDVVSRPFIVKMLQKYSFGSYPMVLYVACKLLQPEIVIETGAGAGLATTFMLKALQENEKGFLYSIEFPRNIYQTESGLRINESYWVPSEKEPCWLVPKDLRDDAHWKLLIGKSSEILPKLIEECRQVDIFFHDSEHTYQNMMFEYQTVYPYLKIGGLLLSHDINLNNAFTDFAAKVDVHPIILKKGFGLIIKS